MEREELAALMTRYQAGDAGAFDALYRELHPRVFSFLLYRTRNRQIAEELFQDVFVKLHRHRATYRPGAPVEPWVFTIARHTAEDFARRRRRRPEDAVEDADAFSGAEMATPDPGVVAALAKLPKEQREAIVLMKLGGLTAEEAAKVVRSTRETIKSRVHRGLLRLQEILAEPGAGAAKKEAKQ